ncbi:response regulator transcription factor [Nesterenkonia ebinurensis]|uniref:response regulator transcription factor n=1 Tax=Nesterenkonia ebinurensis TaxID=2608252 RepID=UPI00123CCBB1|nr:response regulator transcription factor [Nesterenkonia ebinurensis]
MSQSPAAEQIKVMLVDDQHLLRMGFKLILEEEDDLEVVAEAGDGAEALSTLEALGETRPDVVLMDVRMPTMDGIEATQRIAAEFSDTKVIILTTFDLDEYAFSGLQAGASAFLLKDVEPEDLVDAVRVVASGDAVVAPRITQRLLEVYLRKGGQGTTPPGLVSSRSEGAGARLSRENTGTGAESSEVIEASAQRQSTGAQIAAALDDGVVREPLTARETEVLFAVAEGLSNAEIAAKFFLSEATVKTHVRRILTKLQLRDRVQAVVYVYQSGLIE